MTAETSPSPSSAPPDLVASRELAILVAHAMAEKKAEQIVVLEVARLIGITHYFVVCSGRNRRQVQAIADEIELVARKAGHRPYGTEGYRQASWILLDYQDVIAHVFLKEMREYYDLELHWGDAPRIDAGLPEVPAGGLVEDSGEFSAATDDDGEFDREDPPSDEDE